MSENKNTDERIKKAVGEYYSKTINSNSVKETLDKLFEVEDNKKVEDNKSKKEKENRENRETAKNFVDLMNKEIIPGISEVISLTAPIYIHTKEIEAVKKVWECFETLVGLNDPQINSIIALKMAGIVYPRPEEDPEEGEN